MTRVPVYVVKVIKPVYAVKVIKAVGSVTSIWLSKPFTNLSMKGRRLWLGFRGRNHSLWKGRLRVSWLVAMAVRLSVRRPKMEIAEEILAFVFTQEPFIGTLYITRGPHRGGVPARS